MTSYTLEGKRENDCVGRSDVFTQFSKNWLCNWHLCIRERSQVMMSAATWEKVSQVTKYLWPKVLGPSWDLQFKVGAKRLKVLRTTLRFSLLTPTQQTTAPLDGEMGKYDRKFPFTQGTGKKELSDYHDQYLTLFNLLSPSSGWSKKQTSPSLSFSTLLLPLPTHTQKHSQIL